MKRGRRILPAVLVFAALILGAAGIYFYPAWKAAGILREKMETVRFSYEMEIEFDKGGLSESQIRMFRILAELIGVEEGEMYSFLVKGSVWEDRVYALVSLRNLPEPLVELYMDGEEIALNETMVYNAIRSRLVEQYAVLGRMIPEQERNLYISLEEAEQMFGVKLREICVFAFPSMDIGLTEWQYFLMLAAMSREKLEDGTRFGIAADRTKVCFDVRGAGEDASVTMHLDMREPAEALSEMEWLFSGQEVKLPAERLCALENFTMTVAAGDSAEITMPADYVNQNTVDLIAAIRALIEKILGRQWDSESGSI